ncbi:MAG TPA: hypothetical protein VD973_25125, partial [Symbiobacteriaceae bacterium]|nr:hypothetical protein [Symbiobacteriaceae bacterium]
MPAEKRSSAASRWVPVGLLLALAVVAVPLTLGSQSARTGVAFFQRQAPINDVEKAFARAATLDPINSSAQLQYGDLLVQLGVQLKDQVRLTSGGAHLERALELDRFNPDIRMLLANYYKAVGDNERAMVMLEEAVAYNPVSLQVYQRAVAHGLDQTAAHLGAKDLGGARDYLKRTEALFSKFDKMRASQPHEAALLKFVQDDPMMPVYRAQYLLFAGDWDGASALLKGMEQVADPAVRGDVLMWSAALAIQRGDAAGAQQLVNTLLPLDAKKAEQVGTLANLLGESKGIR